MQLPKAGGRWVQLPKAGGMEREEAVLLEQLLDEQEQVPGRMAGGQ